MVGLKPIELFSVVASAIGIASSIGNIYQYFKARSLRQGVDTIDRIGKSAKLECSRLETDAGSEAERAKIRVVSGLISSILNVTTTFMEYKHKHFEKTDKSSPFIAVD